MRKNLIPRLCTEPNCVAPHKARGLCQRHYERAKPLIGVLDQSLPARFWRKVDQTGDCWLWTGAKADTGYGSIGINGRTHNTHRVSWEMHFGPVPDGMLVCHHCDVRECVRPSHLFVGNHQANSTDMVKKGRAKSINPSGEHHWTRRKPERIARGERSGTARLTSAAVVEARTLRRGGWTLEALAQRYEVSETAISAAVRGKTWGHVANP